MNYLPNIINFIGFVCEKRERKSERCIFEFHECPAIYIPLICFIVWSIIPNAEVIRQV